jgi:peptidyl-prolyl cis-trans isomerase B (cyclophilin B)
VTTRAPSPLRSTPLRLVALLATALLVLTACGDGGGSAAGQPGSKGSSGTSGRCSYPSDGQPAAKKVETPPGEPVTTKPTDATLKTNVGNIGITLEADQAPCTVNSFISLAEQGYFDGTSCHRLTTEGIFVLQCGDPTGTGSGGPGYSFDDELVEDDARIQPCQQMQGQQVCTYGPGTVAMANAGPDTNGSQFFLVYDSSPLPAAYTVFGRMDAAGLKVVKQVAKAGVGTPGMGATDGTPKETVTITGVEIG